MTHLLTEAELWKVPSLYGEDSIRHLTAKAQLRHTLSELSAFPGDSRYVAVPREWIDAAKKELGE